MSEQRSETEVASWEMSNKELDVIRERLQQDLCNAGNRRDQAQRDIDNINAVLNRIGNEAPTIANSTTRSIR